jgi:hypothetical protein
MGVRLWLDDRRMSPWGYDLWAKTAEDAIWMLGHHPVDHVSLDHDLADEHYADAERDQSGYMEPPRAIDRSRYRNKTGYAVIEWMRDSGVWPADIGVHTRRTRAAQEMLALLRRCAPAGVRFYRAELTRIA